MLTKAEIQTEKMGTVPEKKKILFVCTGNTCRSPMAAALYNARYAVDGVKAFSAGLAADGCGISRNAMLALLDAGIHSEQENDYLSHISHTVTETDMAEADMVVGITGRHAMQLMLMYPAYAVKITALPVDIPDPYGGNEHEYALCLEQIDFALRQMFLPVSGNCEDGEQNFPAGESGADV